MKCKILIDGKEREVIISGITKSHRREFLDFAKMLAKIDKDDSMDDGEKAEKALKIMDWIEELGLKHSNLPDEDKKKLDLEASDIITETTREILQPAGDKKKS